MELEAELCDHSYRVKTNPMLLFEASLCVAVVTKNSIQNFKFLEPAVDYFMARPHDALLPSVCSSLSYIRVLQGVVALVTRINLHRLVVTECKLQSVLQENFHVMSSRLEWAIDPNNSTRHNTNANFVFESWAI